MSVVSALRGITTPVSSFKVTTYLAVDRSSTRLSLSVSLDCDMGNYSIDSDVIVGWVKVSNAAVDPEKLSIDMSESIKDSA